MPTWRNCNCGLKKPDALRHRGAQGAAVEINRSRNEFPVKAEPASFGEVDVLLETSEAGLYLLHIEPGKEIPLHHHQIMREVEWLVRGNVLRNREPLKKLSPALWQKAEEHSYRNVGSERATLFCCDIPPFISADEIVGKKRSPGNTGSYKAWSNHR